MYINMYNYIYIHPRISIDCQSIAIDQKSSELQVSSGHAQAMLRPPICGGGGGMVVCSTWSLAVSSPDSVPQNACDLAQLLDTALMFEDLLRICLNRSWLACLFLQPATSIAWELCWILWAYFWICFRMCFLYLSISFYIFPYLSISFYIFLLLRPFLQPIPSPGRPVGWIMIARVCPNSLSQLNEEAEIKVLAEHLSSCQLL